MDEDLTLEGFWWLPNNQNVRIPGTVTYTQNSIILRVMGSFENVGPRPLERQDSLIVHEIIHGFSINGKNITLYRCHLEHSTSHNPGGIIATYRATYLFVGRLFNSFEEARFNKIVVRYSNLDSWLLVSGFRHRIEEDGLYEITHKIPQTIETNIDDGTKIKFAFGVNYPTHTLPQIEMTIKQTSYTLLEKNVPTPLNEFLKLVSDLQDFLTLGIGTAVDILSLEGSANDRNIQDERSNPLGVIKIYYNKSDFNKQSRELLAWDVMFHLDDVRNSIGTVLNRWLQLADHLKPVYELYFATLYNPHMYVLNQFLNLTQALETYHRRNPNMKQNIRSEEEHNQRIREILDSIQTHREFLQWRLQHSNEPTLEDRLRELLEKMQGIVDNTPISTLDPHLISSSRNYYTHYDESRREQAITGEPLFWTTIKLQVLLELYLMREVGFVNTKLREILMRKIARRGLQDH